VQKLADAVLAQQAEVSESDIVSSIRDPWRRGATLEENFRRDEQPVPAWGQLIVPGSQPGTYQLAPIQDDAPSGDGE
jgi:hypothetical protein